MPPSLPLVTRTLRGLALAAAAAVAVSACAADPSEDDVTDDPSVDGDRDDEGPVSRTEDALRQCGSCDNCVLHARCLQPRLPYGLTTYASKARIINRGRQSPSAGCVAIFDRNNAYGHVAYVKSVSGGRVTLDEANWQAGRCAARSGTPVQLGITGYFCP